MKKFAVHHNLEDSAKISIFYCKAQNDEDAENKCNSAYPNSTVLDVVEANNAPDDLFQEDNNSNKEIKTADQLISDITEVLGQWDGKDLERIANQILSHPVKYIGDSMFESD